LKNLEDAWEEGIIYCNTCGDKLGILTDYTEGASDPNGWNMRKAFTCNKCMPKDASVYGLDKNCNKIVLGKFGDPKYD